MVIALLLLPMDIRLHNLAKRYRYDWIFRRLDFHFEAGVSYAILGPNGSGKSTLMRVLSGHLTPSKGKIVFEHEGQPIPIDEVYRYLSYAAPYMELIEELTLKESLAFHRRFKAFANGMGEGDIVDLLGFQKSRDKQIRHFSSGMKQRLKLVLAICTDSPLLLLDEPTTNLDAQGFDWYHSLIGRFAAGRLVIVASNEERDYDFCGERLEMGDFK